MPRLIFSQEWRDLLRHFSIFLNVENGEPATSKDYKGKWNIGSSDW